MPEVVHLDDAHAVVFADATERSGKVTWLHRAPGPGGEYEMGGRPGRTHGLAVGELAVSLVLESFTGQVKQWQDPIASMRLDRCEEDLAADTLQLLTDADLPSVDVDVIPAQPKDFAEAQA